MRELPRQIQDAITERYGECREYLPAKERRDELEDLPIYYGHIRYRELDRRNRNVCR